MWIFLRKSGFTKFGGFGAFSLFARKTEKKKKATFSKFWGVGGGGADFGGGNWSSRHESDCEGALGYTIELASDFTCGPAVTLQLWYEHSRLFLVSFPLHLALTYQLCVQRTSNWALCTPPNLTSNQRVRVWVRVRGLGGGRGVRVRVQVRVRFFFGGGGGTKGVRVGFLMQLG